MAEEKEKTVREQRTGERRRFLTEEEFRRLVETGKTLPTDRRDWKGRRKEVEKKKV